jgi:hydroxyacid-oxoacid transhydrogenase
MLAGRIVLSRIRAVAKSSKVVAGAVRPFGGVGGSGSAIFDPEYAFEMSSSSVRFGRGVTKEVGFDVAHSLGIKDKVCVMTDTTMATLPPMKAVVDSLTRGETGIILY